MYVTYYMNKLMIILVAFSTVSLMSGCVSEEQRLAKCEAKGISRDVCYNEEKEYWNNYSANMSRLQAANTQGKVRISGEILLG